METSEIEKEVNTLKPPRNKVFISSSDEDEEWLKKFKVYLKPLEKKGLIDSWDETKIKSGDKWRNEIKKALDSAKVAILLVSSNFLASDYIETNELVPLLLAAEKENAVILSLILDPCESAFSLSKLKDFHPVNRPNKPLSSMSEHEQKKVYDDLAKRVLELVDNVPETRKKDS